MLPAEDPSPIPFPLGKGETHWRGLGVDTPKPRREKFLAPGGGVLTLTAGGAVRRPVITKREVILRRFLMRS